MATRTISIRNLNSNIEALHLTFQEMSTVIYGKSNYVIGNEKEQLFHRIQILEKQIRQKCHQRDCFPADLSDNAYRAYLWLAFLSQRQRFDQHLAFTHAFLERWRDLTNRSIMLKLYNNAFVFQCKPDKKTTQVSINEGFLLAESKDVQMLVNCSLHPTQKNLVPLRALSRANAYKHIMAQIWKHTPQSNLSTQGEIYNLQQLFDKINDEYFSGKLGQPRLRWSGREATRRLGYYHPDSDTITISCFLDQRSIPAYVTEYVLYHEMLHKKLGLKEVNSYRVAHTAQFKKLERKFAKATAAETFLKQIQQK
ncbi:MAG: SprT family zinc-dependent metalloprotease [Chloroflexi bacterium]|nr:SprT family zinc-dependent metalloprotease [Chloroflexota bacterium]